MARQKKETEVVGEPPESELPVTPLPMTKQESETTDEEAELVARLELLRSEKNKTTFMQTAPSRLDALEKAVGENRQFIIELSKTK